jgi:hypothetical protein
MIGALASWILLASPAQALIDPKCADTVRPFDYDEQTQQDFLANYFSLATTLSPIHGPIPHEAGHGAVGLDLLGIPPLKCEKRFVMEFSKTEETNLVPVAPRPRITLAFDGPGNLIPYAGFAYIPPVPLGGTRSVLLAGEVGAGIPFGERLQLGGRFHATMQKTVADVASAFEEGDPVVLDLFLGSTFGLDAMAGFDLGAVVPYVALGFTDVSTFFYVGDDGAIANNLHPYAGPSFSAGMDALVAKNLRVGLEAYGAPGGYSTPDDGALLLKPVARYGRLYTARVRVGFEL